MPFDTPKSNSILDWAFGKGTLSAISNVYIGLSTNDPVADGGTFTELSGNGYARVLINIYNSAYPGLINSASARRILNGRQINWTKATGDWPEAKGVGLFTAATGGSPYFYGTLEEPVTCPAGAVFLFDPETMKVSFPATDVTETTAE